MVRQMFLSEMGQKLREFDEKLERLAARPLPKNERGRLERQKTCCHLQACRAELRERLKQAEHAPDESWREFKDSMQRMYEGMAQRMEISSTREEA